MEWTTFGSDGLAIIESLSSVRGSPICGFLHCHRSGLITHPALIRLDNPSSSTILWSQITKQSTLKTDNGVGEPTTSSTNRPNISSDAGSGKRTEHQKYQMSLYYNKIENGLEIEGRCEKTFSIIAWVFQPGFPLSEHSLFLQGCRSGTFQNNYIHLLKLHCLSNYFSSNSLTSS